MKIGTYLTFDGNCADAFDHYKTVFCVAGFASKTTWGDSPMKDQIPKNTKPTDIMHMSLALTDDFSLMGSDFAPGMSSAGRPHVVGSNIQVSLTPKSTDEADRIFDALLSKEGGTVEKPMKNTFWGSYHGSLRDAFGIRWMIDCELPEPAKDDGAAADGERHKTKTDEPSPSKESKEKKKKTQVGTYLTFNGDCADAFDRYKAVFGGEFPSKMTWADSPMKDKLPKGTKPDDIMHMSLALTDDFTLMGSDFAPGMSGASSNVVGSNVQIALTPKSTDEADRIFDALSKGGTVEKPMKNMFWGSYHGAWRDAHGVRWMIDCEMSKPGNEGGAQQDETAGTKSADAPKRKTDNHETVSTGKRTKVA